VKEGTMATDQIAVIDLETTGLSPWRHDRVVEIGIVVISPDGLVQTEYETLVNPNRDMGPTSLHHITAADVLRAPTFGDVAGDVLDILASACTVAGHNVSFDMNFLVKEYDRIGVSIPEIPLLCTCRLFGRNNLRACCDELGIGFDGMPHRAISDARATARIVSLVCSDDPEILENHRLNDVSWPSLPALKTPCFPREHAQAVHNEPPRFLQRIASKIHHDVEAETPNILAYMALVDRVLEDRIIDKTEENALVDAALNWQLSPAQLQAAHTQYIQNLAILALADGIVTDTERRDLHLVAKLLGQDDSSLDAVLQFAATQLRSAHRTPVDTKRDNDLHGQRVCFTGQLQSTIEGHPITREMAEALATQVGLTVANTVTKKLNILVVADPNTQSRKVKKARGYGIRVLSDAVFWRVAGIPVD
jgi:DNA polymerase-3 subunit epsilon